MWEQRSRVEASSNYKGSADVLSMAYWLQGQGQQCPSFSRQSLIGALLKKPLHLDPQCLWASPVLFGFAL
jgi:hypothetical protein